MTILNLPTSCFVVGDPQFRLAFDDRVERRRSGHEDVFAGPTPRWEARFTVFPDHAGLPSWRHFLGALGGASGLVYVWDVTDPHPVGGALTAAAQAAAGSSPVTWEDGGSPVTWEDGGSPIAWTAFGSAPAVTALRLAASAASGATSVLIEGLWSSRSPVIRAGHYVQVEHWLYTAAADADSDGDGRAVVTLQRPLLRAAAAGTPVNLERAASVMRIDGDPSWSRMGRSAWRPIPLAFVEVMPWEMP